MKYKLIKSFPWCTIEGLIYNTEDKKTINIYGLIFNPADYPEFFELIEEKPTVWDLKEGDDYWFLNGFWIVTITWSGCEYDKISKDIWNCFLTKEEAEKELEKRKLITKLLRSKHEMWLNKEFLRDDNNYFIRNISGISMWFSYADILPILWYFSKDSQEYIDNNKTDLLRLFELTK